MKLWRGKHQCPAVHPEWGRCDRRVGHPVDKVQSHWVHTDKGYLRWGEPK